jgi:mono/diheme cytochrome c family protein
MNDVRHSESPPGISPAVKPAQTRERIDPGEKQRPLPWFVIMLIGAMAMWGVFYINDTRFDLDSRYGDSRTPSALQPPPVKAGGGTHVATAAVDGAQIYASKCAACHQATGLGIPGVFPPLAGSEWVLGSDKLLVQIPLHGIAGALQVKGVTYNGAMPSFNTLADDEIAAVLTHVRSQWGNGAPPVAAATVTAGREGSKARSTPWGSGDEIKRGAAP